MPKKKSDAVADEFSNHEMEQIKRYGEAAPQPTGKDSTAMTR